MRLDLSGYLPKLTIDVPIRPPQRWFRHSTLAWIVGLGLVGLAVVVALLPALMSARYRAAGEAAMNSNAGSAADAFQQALRWSPDDPQIYRALAQSYLRLNQPHEAVGALERAYRLLPNSLLVQQELAQAYEASGQLERADDIWAGVGLTPSHMLQTGDMAFAQLDFAASYAWYERAARVQPKQPFDRVFQHAIAATIVGASDAQALLKSAQRLDPSFSTYQLGQQLRIDGSQLRWINSESRRVLPGASLSQASNQLIGMFWWSGEALAVVSAEQTRAYTLSVNLRHSRPAPVRMAVGVDGQQLQVITLDRGDDSWQTISVPVRLSAGLHTINVWFLNNAIVEGVDRDASIDWIVIKEDRP